MNAATSQTIWPAPDGGVWELDRAHQTGIASAAIAELMPEPFAEGFRHAFAELGLPLSHIAIEFINGRTYTSAFVHGAPRKGGSAPPDFVIRTMSMLLPSARRRTRIATTSLAENRPMRTVERWDRMRPGWIERVLRWQDVDVDTLDDLELAAYVDQLALFCREGIRLHFELLNASAAFGAFLVATKRWGLDLDFSTRAVMHGVPVHREAAERMALLVASLGGASFDSLADIAAHGAEAAAALEEYLRYHGSWATTDDVSGPTLREQPELLVQSIRRFRPPIDHRAELLQDLRGQVPTADRDEFDRLADEAQRAHACLEDNSALLASWPLGLLGRMMRSSARRLVHRGDLAGESDVWTLTTAELVELLRGTATIDPDSIRSRVEWMHRMADLEPPRTLNGEPSLVPNSSAFPPAVGHWVAAMGAFIEAKTFTREPIGIGSSAVTGRAVLAESVQDALERIEPGDILITRGTSPAFGALMPILGGVVTSEGGLACHAAVMARELGFSAIVGMPGAFDSIPDGAQIVLDPMTVTITPIAAATPP